MSMRIHEIHPALVHYPLALMPTAIAADALGRITGSEGLLALGRRLTPLAAASGLLAGIFGLVAQEAVRVDGESAELLATHRTLNLGVVALATAMAGKRVRMRRPSLGYLAVGAAGVAIMGYSAYLGGAMVYAHGVGVAPADGVLDERDPELTPHDLPAAAHAVRDNLRTGLEHTLDSASHPSRHPTDAGLMPEFDGKIMH